MTKRKSGAEIFRRASESFGEGVARSQPNWNELGDRAWASMLAENNTYESGKRMAIEWRARDAGWEDE
jgi:hypothetical protein